MTLPAAHLTNSIAGSSLGPLVQLPWQYHFVDQVNGLSATNMSTALQVVNNLGSPGSDCYLGSTRTITMSTGGFGRTTFYPLLRLVHARTAPF